MITFTQILLTGALSLLICTGVLSQETAFPGAEGFGRYALGGRGGIVVEVTNLQDAGTGSFRAALNNYYGQKRTIVFRVSGTISLESAIEVKNDQYITIAGQTAPGEGICLKNYPLKFSDCEDIIVRYLRIRPGDDQACTDPACDDVDAISIRNCQNIILDHCSLSWSIDAILDLTVGTGKSTVQYCLLSEALMNSKHSKGAHSYAAGWDGQGGASYHHNIIASCNSRTPRLDKYISDEGVRDRIDIVNNLIYNWSGNGAYGGEFADVNWQNNYYRYGPSTGKRNQIFQVDGSCKIFVDGNFVTGYPEVTLDNSKGIYYLGNRASESILDTTLQDSPFDTEALYMEAAEMVYSSVLSHAGASFPVRDDVDKRIVNDIINKTGAIIDSPSQVGGWPELQGIEAPADDDHDGMADAWELAVGLDPGNPDDRNLDRNSDGYTNLEEYINGIIQVTEFVYRPAITILENARDREVRIGWADFSDNETAFIIERAADEAFAEIASMPENNTAFTDTVPAYGEYSYRIKAVNGDTSSLYSDPVQVSVLNRVAVLPGHSPVHLSVYPNPFKMETRVVFYLEQSSEVRIKILDISGREIARLYDGDLGAGQQIFKWEGLQGDGCRVSPGIYLLLLSSCMGNSVMLLIRE